MILVRKRFTWMMCMAMLPLACVEPFEATSIVYESALVVEATITNELKQQKVILSRTYKLEEDGPKPERKAMVRIVNDRGGEYDFSEAGAGEYFSQMPFAAQAGTKYQLFITTSEGKSYTSEMTQLTPVAQIDEINATRLVNNAGIEGVAIQVDASSSSGNARNYRYTYAETYKIIAPEWTQQDLRVPDPPPGENEAPGCDLDIVPRDSEEQTCYATDLSNSIILTETNDFAEDRVNGFRLRFISRDNYIISHRYSILVRQLVQSPAAYTYFDTLSRFSGTESLFSETQPGFIAGNLFSVSDPDEKVLGYFDVASVTEQRIFFNYDDLFPGEPLPPYADPCNLGAPPLSNPSGCVLRPIVASNLVSYAGSNSPGPFSPGPGPYLTVPRICGDCTVLGESEVPDFWTEE
jgi:hypothetical protein